MFKKTVLFTLLAISLSLLFGQNTPNKIEGEWWSHGGKNESKSIVKIFKKGNEYFGKIIWLREPKDENGNEKLDIENPKKNLRKRKINGLEILQGFRYNFDDQKWEDGTIYNPEDGKTYKCFMELLDDGTLKVRGFVGFSLIGKTQIWTKK